MMIASPRFSLDSLDNYFLQGGGAGWFAVCTTNYTGPLLNLDFTGNYWGTTDVDYISQWILDNHDNPEIHFTIDFVPMADSPVPVEQKTWSEVKGLFRE
jgi:hypothetical protein